jgi:putative lipoprotein
MKAPRRSLLLGAFAVLAMPDRAAGATPPDPREFLDIHWRVEEIGTQGVLHPVVPGLGFTAGGRVRGQSGCNGFSGPYVAEGAALRIGPVAATMMGCRGAIGEQERRFFAALGQVRGWRLEGGLLHLTNAEGATLVRLAR